MSTHNKYFARLEPVREPRLAIALVRGLSSTHAQFILTRSLDTGTV